MIKENHHYHSTDSVLSMVFRTQDNNEIVLSVEYVSNNVSCPVRPWSSRKAEQQIE
jgi:hypothetical protein